MHDSHSHSRNVKGHRVYMFVKCIYMFSACVCDKLTQSISAKFIRIPNVVVEK